MDEQSFTPEQLEFLKSFADNARAGSRVAAWAVKIVTFLAAVGSVWAFVAALRH